MDNTDARKNRFNNIRASLKTNPIMTKNTAIIQAKIEKRKKRRQSLKLEDDFLTQSQQKILNEDDSSIKAISKFNERYQLGEKIGQGSNGLVRKCYRKDTKQLFAVKSMMMDDEHILFLKKNFMQIRSLDNKHIIKYQAMFLDLRKHICYLVMDYESLPNLNEIKDLTQIQIKTIIFQLLLTLDYIHSNGICHRDIKPDNILYDRQKKQIKIIDFGISKKIKERNHTKEMLTITGTLFYRAPEMFLGGGYDEKVDIWAAGITLYYLISKVTPFQSEFHSETIKNIEKGQINFGTQWQNYNKFAKDLVIRLLRDRNDRLSAKEARTHLWFSHDVGLEIDLTKSDNLSFKFASKLPEKFSEDYGYTFQRSLTNQKQKLSIQSIEQEDQQKKNNVKINSLKKWLTGSDDDDCLIQIDSQGELQSPCLQNTVK